MKSLHQNVANDHVFLDRLLIFNLQSSTSLCTITPSQNHPEISGNRIIIIELERQTTIPNMDTRNNQTTKHTYSMHLTRCSPIARLSSIQPLFSYLPKHVRDSEIMSETITPGD